MMGSSSVYIELEIGKRRDEDGDGDGSEEERREVRQIQENNSDSRLISVFYRHFPLFFNSPNRTLTYRQIRCFMLLLRLIDGNL